MKCKYYSIDGADEKIKNSNMKLWKKIKMEGHGIENRWFQCYLISTYSYDGKIYDLWENMSNGVLSNIVERNEELGEEL